MAKALVEEELIESTDDTVDLYGEFRFKVDAKGRVALPAKFRKVLSKDLVVTKDPMTGNCLYVFEDAGFNQWVNQLFESRFGGYDATDPEHIKLRRGLKRGADIVEVDSSGRIMLNAKFRQEVGIQKNVVLVGNTGYFEIWDADAFDEAMDEVDLSVFFKKDAAKSVSPARS